MAKKRKRKDIYKRTVKILTAMIIFAVVMNVSLFFYFKTEKYQSADSDFTDVPVVTTESKTDSETTKKPDETTVISESTSETTTDLETTYIDPYDMERITVNPDDTEWNLIVVNASREIPEGYEPELKEILNSGKYLDYRVAPYYEEMYYAAEKDGIILTPFSGYRSYERQKINYENLTSTYMTRYGISEEEAAKKAATVILPPGTSEHNLGLAMDICNTYDSFADSKEYKWLTEHAHEYGFILRYTSEKQYITGIVAEPWHWRFVGKEYAKEIKDSGLCLEEWLSLKS